MSSLLSASSEVNTFSITSYHLNSSGFVSTCEANYSACSWDGSVERFNADVVAASGGRLAAVPLVFNNAGHMVQDFRTMVAAGQQTQVVEYLAGAAKTFGYDALSLDLEPSCWAANSTLCQFPTKSDVDAFYAFIDSLADALHKQGQRLTIAAGSYPVSQCDGGFAQAQLCSEDYVARCADGRYNKSTCNCCGFITWFDAPALCGSKADRIVNMDTYMNAPFNGSFFNAANDWYLSQGCSVEKLALGLLTGEAASDGDIAHLFDLIDQSGVTELDIWANVWTSDTLLLWQDRLEAFLAQ